MNQWNSCLQPTELCDFDKDSLLLEKTLELTRGCGGQGQRFERLYGYVKELPYGLEDWDVRASETLKKGWGMCCGKTNLLVAMSRALLIPARYRVFRIKAESRLLVWATKQHKELAIKFGDLPLEQDHLECEVFLDSHWQNFDPSRDSAMEAGLRTLGIPLEREPVAGADGAVHFACLVSVDEWARKRQVSRRFRGERETLFPMVNEQLDRIRLLGRETQ